MKEKKARVEDAMLATQAAAEEGIVAGGGVTQLRAGTALTTLRKDAALTDDERAGVGIVARSIEEPMRWIAQNAGLPGAVVVAKVLEPAGDQGFKADTEKYANLVKAGAIDPTKVVRCALQNAASVAGLMLTTEAVISERPEQDETASSTARGRASGLEDYSQSRRRTTRRVTAATPPRVPPPTKR